MLLRRVLLERGLGLPDLVADHPCVVGRIEADLEADHPAVLGPGPLDEVLQRDPHLLLRARLDRQVDDQHHPLPGVDFGRRLVSDHRFPLEYGRTGATGISLARTYLERGTLRTDRTCVKEIPSHIRMIASRCSRE